MDSFSLNAIQKGLAVQCCVYETHTLHKMNKCGSREYNGNDPHRPLLLRIWEYNADDDATMRVAILRLRQRVNAESMSRELVYWAHPPDHQSNIEKHN